MKYSKQSIFVHGILATLLMLGAGCAPAKPSEVKVPVETAPIVNTFTHPKFGFSFVLPTGITAQFEKNGNDARFVDPKKSGVEYGRMIVQPGIPGVPLAQNKIEPLVADGAKVFLYHDTDAADGGKLDKLILDFPDGSNAIYIAAPELPSQPMWDLKTVVASWKWKK